jgi:orotate phosphoribosyltransferase
METSRLSPNRLTNRANAFKIIKERSFTFGDFTLASGAKSKYYLDMKPTMFHPEGANLLAELILDRLQGMSADCIGGLEMGAVPLIAPINMLSYVTTRPLPGFFVRKTVKDHGTRKLIEGMDDIRGKNAVILDDVTTTGQSAMLAVEAAREAGANVVLVLSIVDREEGAEEFYRKAGVPFSSLFRASEFLAD